MRKIKTSRSDKTKSQVVAAPKSRYDELRRILEDRRREIVSALQEKMRDVRTENGVINTQAVLDEGEASEGSIREDIEFALIQMKAETLNRIDEALARLEDGNFGNCVECGDEIASPRLRALPFAVRCIDCEEAREQAALRERSLSQRRSSSALFMDMSS